VLQIGNFGLLLLWCILHFLVNVWYFLLEIVHAVEGYFISSGLLKRYEALNLGKLRYLAIVVGSEEAYQTSEITKILQWLETFGVKHVCLYDTEGETHAFNKVEVLQLLRNNVKVCMQLLFCK
jgi:ditrans,polycis-polyprenyl diphosphate synthase